MKIRLIIILVLIIGIIPNIVLAAWWNPFTWKIFNRESTASSKVKEIRTNESVSTTTLNQPKKIEEIKGQPQKDTEVSSNIVKTNTVLAPSVIAPVEVEKPDKLPTVTPVVSVVSYDACGPFNRNVSTGDVGEDVTLLQVFLHSKKLLDRNSINSNFDEITLIALKKYQSDIGIADTGVLDPMTRAYLNGVCFNEEPKVTTPSVPIKESIPEKPPIVDTTKPSITLTSPTGGENYKPGDTIQVRYSTKNIPDDHEINVSLVLVSENKTSKVFSPTVGRTHMFNTGAFDVYLPPVPPGNYKVSLHYYRGDTDFSTWTNSALFTIEDGPAKSVDPVINLSNSVISSGDSVMVSLKDPNSLRVPRIMVYCSSPVIILKPTNAWCYEALPYQLYPNPSYLYPTATTEFSIVNQGKNSATIELVYGVAKAQITVNPIVSPTDSNTKSENKSPKANNDSMDALINTPTELSVDKLLLNDSDPDGDPISFNSVDIKTTQGGKILFSNKSLTYTPPTDFLGVDLFSYIIQDSSGNNASGTVSVNVRDISVTFIKPISKETLEDGSIKVMFIGIPNFLYSIKTSNDNGKTWSNPIDTLSDATGKYFIIHPALEGEIVYKAS